MTKKSKPSPSKKTRPTSGGGRAAMAVLHEARAAVPVGESMPKALQLTAQAGTPHLKPLKEDTERQVRFVNAVRLRGNYSAAAMDCDGFGNTSRAFKQHMKDSPAFKQAVLEAMESYGARIAQTVHLLAVEGLSEPIVSCGEVVAHKKVFDGKLLAQLFKMHSADFKKANESQSANVQVNINSGANIDSDPNDPSWTLRKSDTYFLSPQDCDALERIVGLIMTRRRNGELAEIDFSRPLELEDCSAEDAAFEAIDDSNPFNI